MDFDAALAAHQDWKVKLRGALNGKIALNPATVGRNDCCDLGKWLLGEAKAKHGAEPTYRECVEAHTAFHREAGKVAALINAGKRDEAEKALNVGSPYAVASLKVGSSIVHMRRLHAQAA